MCDHWACKMKWIESNVDVVCSFNGYWKDLTYLYSAVYDAICANQPASQPFLVSVFKTLSMGNYNYNFFLMCDTARMFFARSSSSYLCFLSISFFLSFIHSFFLSHYLECIHSLCVYIYILTNAYSVQFAMALCMQNE